MPTLLVLALCQIAFPKQKILVIVESDAYWQTYQNVTQYVNDITNYDHKKAEYIIWTNVGGNNYGQCMPLWDTLQAQYFFALSQGDVLEGAVLVGAIPVPIYETTFGPFPLDQVYMDIVDVTSGTPQPYTSTPFQWNYGGYFTGTYRLDLPHDSKYDIWISRVDAQYLNDGIRRGWTVIDEYAIYNNYLAKVHDRMTSSANVPSRGFAMGGPMDYFTSYPLHDVIGSSMLELKLPWLAEFTGGDNSSYNWMSQLLAGPRGCINYGAFNGSLFASERNRRYCRFDALSTVYENGNSTLTSQSIANSDSLGWEWAGLYNHSNPDFTNFHANLAGTTLNGIFSFGCLGPFWGTNYHVNSGYNGGHYYYQDANGNPNPYNFTLGWKEKRAQWRWSVPATNTYDVYVYYDAPDSPNQNTNNCNYVEYYLNEFSVDANGVPLLQTGNHASYSIDQRMHTIPLATDHHWELIMTGVSLTSGNMVYLEIPTNRGWHPLAPGSFITGDQIADAVRFVSTDGLTNEIVDDATPTSYADVDNSPWEILSTGGFLTDDEIHRTYEDMGNEPGGGGFSKPQFFLTNCCDINNFVYSTRILEFPNDPNYPGASIVKNIGNLYALGHNGLICMGTSTMNYADIDQSPFTSALATGKDFGEAYLAQQNANFNVVYYNLLGGGSLHAQPYIQYGTQVEQARTITGNESTSTHAPVSIAGISVTGAGNWEVTSNHDVTLSPFGTHSEIVIRPETDLAPTGANSVHLIAN
jgi:hypothetical protein